MLRNELFEFGGLAAELVRLKVDVIVALYTPCGLAAKEATLCIKAFSETDQTEDLKKIDVPTLIMQGDDDQIVPFADSGLLQSKLVNGVTLKVYKGAPHGLCTTLKDEVNADLLAFIERKEARRAA
jgi:non-heme chloroperoxidase